MMLLKESRLLRYFLYPGKTASIFETSIFFRWFLQFFNSLTGSSAFFQRRIQGLGKWCLAGALFACVFLPRVSIGFISLFYSIDLRVEDILFLFLGFFVLIRMGAHVETSDAGISRIEKAFVAFLFICGISILNGMVLRTLDKPWMSFFYLLKWVEYFFVFFVTVHLAANRSTSIFFLKVFFVLGLSVACYGYWEHFFPAVKAVYPNYYRLFERPPFHGDANHIGGLLVFWMGFFSGIFLKTQKRSERIILFAALLFVFFPFIWTYSRKSYFALAGAFIFLLLFHGDRKKVLWLICILILLAFLFPTRLAERLMNLGEIFSSADPFHSSWAGNWVMWKKAFWNFDRFFLLGCGLGARHRVFYESQYILVLSETGIIGFGFFFALCLAPVREIFLTFRRSLSAEEKGIALGWLIGFAALLIHNASCVSLTVAKIAMPFWFLTAAVIMRLKQTTTS